MRLINIFSHLLLVVVIALTVMTTKTALAKTTNDSVEAEQIVLDSSKYYLDQFRP